MNNPEAPQILSKEREDELLRAINTRNWEAPYFNLRNILRLAAADAFEMGRQNSQTGGAFTTTSDPMPIPPWERRELMPYMSLNEGCRKYEEKKYERELAEWKDRNK